MSPIDIVFHPAPACCVRKADKRGVRAIAQPTILAANPACFSTDDMVDLVARCAGLPGDGLRQPGSSGSIGCVHYTGIELVGTDAYGPYGVQICRDGYVTAAHGRGVLPLHAAAVAEELRWHDRVRYAPLHSALLPKGSLLVDLNRLAEVAQSMPRQRWQRLRELLDTRDRP